MSDERIDEVLRRLEALENVVRERDQSMSEHRGHHGHRCRHNCDCHHDCDCHRHHRDRDRECDCHHHRDRDRDRRDCGCRGGRHDRGDDGIDERRLVDLIVGLVAEHVEAIVERQLNRVLDMEPTGETPPADDS